LSAGYSGLLRLEAGSPSLASYCAVVPHPLLMTPDYIREVVLSTWQTPSAQELSRRIRVCVRRQSVLDQEGPSLALSAVIDESVLRRSATPPGAPQGVRILRDQMDRLVTDAARPNVTGLRDADRDGAAAGGIHRLIRGAMADLAADGQ
jgi:hypothetical protein